MFAPLQAKLKHLFRLAKFDGGNVGKSTPVTTVVQTWTNANETYTAKLTNITNTASAAASLIEDWQVGGVSKFGLFSDGSIYTLGATPSQGANVLGNNTLFGSSGNIRVYTTPSPNLIDLGSTSLIGWGSGTVPNSTYDVALFRDAANTLAQRNGTNAQTFNLYRSYTDASNYSRLSHKWNTSTAIIQAEGLGTGTNGSVAFNNAALATNATVGFMMLPSCAGAPTGVPADIPTGQIPMVYDSTNNKIYAYNGAWKSTVALT